MIENTNVFIILGAQGSGKGTQAKFIANLLNLSYFSIGEELMKIRNTKTKIGKIVAYYYDKGLLLPEKYTIRVVEKAFKLLKSKKGLIVDGYPRTLQQVKSFERILNKYKLLSPLVIYLKINIKTALKRIASRKLCSICGRSYNPNEQEYILNTCQKCQKPLSIRSDDTPDAIKSRLNIFMKLTKPTIAYFKSKNLLLEVNGELSIKDVSNEISDNFKRLGIL